MRKIKFRAWHIKQGMYDWRYILENDLFGTWANQFNTRTNTFDDGTIKLMQFTGLLDKNGRDIYEGDIVRWDNDSNYQVIFADGGFWLDGFDNEHGWPSEELIEVIGNIYEHPELLK